MQCDHFDAGRCRSCSWMGRPYAQQLLDVDALAREALAGRVPDDAWEPVAHGPEAGFRNKAKMVVAGTVDRPTLGILDPDGRGVDLRDCGLHDPRLVRALPLLAEHVGRADLRPYDVPGRRGELKHLLVTVAPDGGLMVRWVLRSTEALPRLRKHLPWLRERLPDLAVASANVQPVHAAVLEGPEEHLLGDRTTLPVELGLGSGPLRLHLRPGGFWQTNHHVAAALYDAAADWLTDPTPRRAGTWDLYCGVGGFALAVVAARRGTSGADLGEVVGVETSEEAVAAARLAADEQGLDARFEVADAVRFAEGSDRAAHPGTVVVNPPRRGIGALTEWIRDSEVDRLLYSSCHLGSLAGDLDRLPGWEVRRARVFDMFPQTAHVETLVLLTRRS